MSGMVKEKKWTGDISNRVERFETGGFSGDLFHTRSVLGALGLRSERVPVGKTGEERKILMGPEKVKDSTKEFEKALALKEGRKYVLRLYVTGTTPKSVIAIRNIRKICDEYLKGTYDLEVIDIYQQPVLAKGEQIIAAPTLLKKLPLPLRRFIGDMSNTEKILLGLDFKPKKK
jgi:circadian clock protein KaiB